MSQVEILPYVLLIGAAALLATWHVATRKRKGTKVAG